MTGQQKAERIEIAEQAAAQQYSDRQLSAVEFVRLLRGWWVTPPATGSGSHAPPVL